MDDEFAIKNYSVEAAWRLVGDLTDESRDGKAVSDGERIIALRKLMTDGKIQTLSTLLPLLLNLDGKPYSLKHHIQFEPLFRMRRPKRSLMLTGRQLSKTTTEAASGVMRCNCIPYYKILYITPLFEQARRLSSNYVRKFIEQSPVRHLFQGPNTENSVLQKSFRNFSQMHFSFALLDADRIRGLSADENCYDEAQDLDRDFFPIIGETMSHSRWGGLTNYAGTPKTTENTINGLWKASSQAEWFIPCPNCKHDNICSTEYDLDKIIGPYWEPGENEPFLGTICARCQHMINPISGFWVHRFPERRWTFPGYHVSQPIMHIHYSNSAKWGELLAKREGQGNYTPAKYFNEVLGESCGTGSQLVSQEELEAASILPWPNNPRDMTFSAAQARKNAYRVLAIDWGGGGEDEISLTTLAVLGWLPTGHIHVIWGRRLMTPHDHLGEADVCREVFHRFRCTLLAHDYTGAGALRETFLRHHRIPLGRIVPIAYVRAASKGIMTYKPATDIHPRSHYILDKTRALQHVCAAIKMKLIQFFQYDYVDPDNPGLINDFVGLVENKVPTSRGSDIYTIQRHATLSDDFAQSVNIGACTIWHITKRWPNLGPGAGPVTSEQMRSAVELEAEGQDEQDFEGFLCTP